MFQEATKHWNVQISIEQIIKSFFSRMKLTAQIYDDTILSISQLKKMGYKIAALTNLPSAMPDYLFRADIPKILDILDLYVSSEICRYRKPNIAGLKYIAEHFEADISDLFFVGDEKLDIDTAKNAGCKSILINRKQEFKNYQQDAVVENLMDLPLLDIVNN